MDSNKFLENKVNNVIKVISRYANRPESKDSVTDKYFRLLADNLRAILLIETSFSEILLIETSFSEKIKAIEFVMLDIDNNGIIGLAKEYVNLAIEQAVEFDKNEVNK